MSFLPASAVVAVESADAGASVADERAINEASLRMRAVMDMGQSGPDTRQTADKLLSMARDPGERAGVRAQALIAYGRVAGRLGMGGEASRAVWQLKGKLGGIIDPTYDAVAAIGPAALPMLAPELRRCRDREPHNGPVMDPKTVIELDQALMAATALMLIVAEHPAAAEARGLAPELVRCLGCGDGRTRQLCGRALVALGKLQRRELTALRIRLRSDRRADGRALAATVLASAGDAQSIVSLERALSDRAELVQLSSANALIQLGRPVRARSALERLRDSRDAEIAALASQALQK
jgi:hypothetical protein